MKKGSLRSALAMVAALVTSAAVAACAPDAADVADVAVEPAGPSLSAPYGSPIPGIDDEARASFERGARVAARRFAPSSGLGPEYNAVSCAGCHEKPVLGGGASRYRTVFVGAESKDDFVVPFERHFTVDSVSTTRRGPTAATRTPPPFFGAGLLAEIPASEIMSRVDADDADGDGVRGKVNFERGFVGRFGRKAQMASLSGFVRLALFDHLGVTSAPVDMPFLAQADVPVELPTGDADGIADPEIAPSDLRDLLAFTALLAPPPPDPPTETTRAGAALFSKIGCATCHVPELKGPRGPVRAYTDLLLHDMGPGLADGVAVGIAKSSEFRTQPLWGIAAAAPYLHDGRADTLDEAIRAHGGEAERAAASYAALSTSDREALLTFLRSLGGADRKSDGLLPREEPIASVTAASAFGSLSADDAARFVRGRDAFDRDFKKTDGIGPRFNGDACRSCHFDPVIGGAGPSDVDAVRYGSLLTDGTFRPPHAVEGETLAPRFDIALGRPVLDSASTFFERRQTPTVLGLGLLDAVPDDVIRAYADPDDRDGDGIRGIASLLPDGRVGRFGWKAQLATLESFVRDAQTNELGLSPTDPAEASFGDLAFFVAKLAPPKRGPVGPDETAGEAVFARVGCANCHRPELPTHDGARARAFTDLLLHDVAPPGARFVPQGPAGERHFRTPPLWGIAATAPYFHDGQAETLDAAIRRHDSEGARSRDAYVTASDADRAALLAFLRSL